MWLKVRHLEALRAVAAGGTVTKAAALLKITQPAVSRLLIQLERETGLALFVRQGRRLLLSHEGEVFLGESRRVFAALEHVGTVARGLKAGEFGRLHVTAQSAFEVGLIPTATEILEPQVDLLVRLHPRSELVGRLGSDWYDVGLAAMPLPGFEGSMEQFAALDACCILPAAHPLATKDVITARDLNGQSFVAAGAGSLMQARVEEVLQSSKVRLGRRIDAPTTAAGWYFVAAGAGISIVHGFARLVDNGSVVTRPFVPRIGFEYALLRPTAGGPSRLGERFAQAVRAAAERL